MSLGAEKSLLPNLTRKLLWFCYEFLCDLHQFPHRIYEADILRQISVFSANPSVNYDHNLSLDKPITPTSAVQSTKITNVYLEQVDFGVTGEDSGSTGTALLQ